MCIPKTLGLIGYLSDVLPRPRDYRRGAPEVSLPVCSERPSRLHFSYLKVQSFEPVTISLYKPVLLLNVFLLTLAAFEPCTSPHLTASMLCCRRLWRSRWIPNPYDSIVPAILIMSIKKANGLKIFLALKELAKELIVGGEVLGLETESGLFGASPNEVSSFCFPHSYTQT